MKTKTSIEDLIKKHDFSYVTPMATENNFPPQPIGDMTTAKVLHFGESLTQDQLETRVKEQEYRLANAYELLSWEGWNGKDLIIAAGQIFVDAYRDRYALYFLRNGVGERHLNHYWLSPGELWGDYWFFLVLQTE